MPKETRKKTTAPTRSGTRRKTARSSVSSEERHRMIAEAAYYKAIERGPGNADPMGDWLAAEAEIDASLLEVSGSPRRKPRTSSPRRRTTS